MTTKGKVILTVLTLAALSYFVYLNAEVAHGGNQSVTSIRPFHALRL